MQHLQCAEEMGFQQEKHGKDLEWNQNKRRVHLTKMSRMVSRAEMENYNCQKSDEGSKKLFLVGMIRETRHSKKVK